MLRCRESQLHFLVAVGGFFLGTAILAARRGTPLHRWLGRGFALAALATALSSFFIHEIQQWGQWSWIHLLSAYVTAGTVIGYRAIRRGDVRGHMTTMVPIYPGGFVVAGAFTLLPGRTTFEVFLEPSFEAVFAGNWDMITLVAWVFPLLGCIAAIYLWRRTLKPTPRR